MAQPQTKERQTAGQSAREEGQRALESSQYLRLELEPWGGPDPSPPEYSVKPEAMYVYYYRTYEKAVSGGGEREKGGHVLRDTTSRGLYVRVWPPHTSERRGGGGGCEQEGWQGGEGRARMSGQEELQRHIRRR